MNGLFAAFNAVLVSLSILHNPVKEDLSIGRFRQVKLFSPKTTPERLLIILLSNPFQFEVAEGVAEDLVKSGTSTALVDLSQYDEMNRTPGRCVDFGQDLATLSHALAHRFKMPDLPPAAILAPSELQAWGLAAIEQAPVGSFVALFRAPIDKNSNVKFSPKPSCESFSLPKMKTLTQEQIKNSPDHSFSSDLVLDIPFPNVLSERSFSDVIKRENLLSSVRTLLHDAYRAAGSLESVEHMSRARVERLELLEEAPTSITSHELVILFSGDGGWADFANDIASGFVKSGRPVVGVNLIPYFWQGRSANAIARDIESIYRVYKDKWKTTSLRLVGFSHGADILPFAINRMDNDVRSHVVGVALISPSRTTDFEFSMGSWFHDSDSGPLVIPELKHMIGNKMNILCLYGEDEAAISLCKALNDSGAKESGLQVEQLAGGHHLNGATDVAVERILSRSLP